MFTNLQTTQFFGKNLIYLPTCASTNAEAQTYLQAQPNTQITEGTIIITGNQTAGRGQRGNTWEAMPNTNLTFSLILSPKFLTITEQFKLNVAITVGITDSLLHILPSIAIKWSNDIYVKKENIAKKIGGILIENTIQQQYIANSIIGIGLNVNQVIFQTPIASSLAKENQSNYDLQAVLENLMIGIENRYLQLRGGQYELLKNIYLQRLYRFQEVHSYQSNGQDFLGMIIGIDSYGRLAMQVENTVKYFDIKEITFL